MCVAQETAIYIFRRRNAIAIGLEILAYVDKIQEQENQLHEHQLVVFLHDCFSKAVNKSLKLKQGESGVRKIHKKWKDYQKYVELIPLITENRINPFSFFSFIVEARRSKKIPATIQNVATAKSVDHYLKYLKSNTYRVSTYNAHKDYEDTLYNQLNIDLISLTTFLLRKPRVSLSTFETFLFSSPSRILIAMSRAELLELSSTEERFYEDMMFDPSFAQRIKRKWNTLLELQISQVRSLEHELRDQNFLVKLAEIISLLEVLKIT